MPANKRAPRTPGKSTDSNPIAVNSIYKCCAYFLAVQSSSLRTENNAKEPTILLDKTGSGCAESALTFKGRF